MYSTTIWGPRVSLAADENHIILIIKLPYWEKSPRGCDRIQSFLLLWPITLAVTLPLHYQFNFHFCVPKNVFQWIIQRFFFLNFGSAHLLQQFKYHKMLRYLSKRNLRVLQTPILSELTVRISWCFNLSDSDSPTDYKVFPGILTTFSLRRLCTQTYMSSMPLLLHLQGHSLILKIVMADEKRNNNPLPHRYNNWSLVLFMNKIYKKFNYRFHEEQFRKKLTFEFSSKGASWSFGFHFFLFFSPVSECCIFFP